MAARGSVLRRRPPTRVEILTAGRDLWGWSHQRAFWRGGAGPGRLAETGAGGQERQIGHQSGRDGESCTISRSA